MVVLWIFGEIITIYHLYLIFYEEGILVKWSICVDEVFPRVVG